MSSGPHAKDDGDVFVGDLNALDAGVQDRTAQLPIGVGASLTEVGSELLHLAHQQSHCTERTGVVAVY